MKKVVTALIIIVVIVAGVALLSTHKSAAPGNKASDSAKTTANQTNQVMIQNMAFSPASITISHGTTVTWMNMDSVAHTVTETDTMAGPKSGDIAPGKSFIFTFDKPGTYHYRCDIHPAMTGTVTVTE